MSQALGSARQGRIEDRLRDHGAKLQKKHEEMEKKEMEKIKEMSKKGGNIDKYTLSKFNKEFKSALEGIF